MRQKLEVLDSLRAFAALSVCLFHFVCTTTGYITNESVLGIFSAGKYGVQLFFVISGFVIPWSMYHSGYRYNNFLSFFIKRLARLEPPYLVSILIALAILILRQYSGRSNSHIEVSLSQVLLHLGYLIPWFKDYDWLNQVYWTLAVEFQYYLFIALVFIPLIQSNLMIRLSIYLLMLSAKFIGNDEFLPYWLPFFLLGILLSLYRTGIIKNTEFYGVTILTLTLCVYWYDIAATLYAVIPLFMVLWYQDLKIPFLHSVGKFSYSLYLVHPLIGASYINVLSHYFDSPSAKILVILSALILTLLSAWLMYHLIEKRSKNWSSAIRYNTGEKTETIITKR